MSAGAVEQHGEGEKHGWLTGKKPCTRGWGTRERLCCDHSWGPRCVITHNLEPKKKSNTHIFTVQDSQEFLDYKLADCQRRLIDRASSKWVHVSMRVRV